MRVTTIAGGISATSFSSGGRFYIFNNISTVPQAGVAPALPQRVRLVFHNPGDVDILVAPVSHNTSGADAPFTPSNASRGGCFLVYANGGTLIVEGECQKAWQALSVSGSGKPLTVMDSVI